MTEEPKLPGREANAAEWFARLAEALRAFILAAGTPEQLAARVADHVARATRTVCVVAFYREDMTWDARVQAGEGGGPAPSLAELDDFLAALSSTPGASRVPQGSPLLEDLAVVPDYFRTRQLGACIQASLQFAGEPLGVIVVARPADVGPLSQTQRDLLWALAERAAIARHHGRVIASALKEVNERRRLAERLRSLAEASRAFAAASVDYRSLLDVVARTTAAILGDVCSIRLISADGEWLRREDASVYHADPAVVAQFERAITDTPQRVGQGLTGEVAATGRAYFKPHVDPVGLASRTLSAYRPLADQVEVASLMLVPVMAPGRCLGVLSVSRTSSSPPYDLDDLQLLQDLADRAALAVQNAALLRDLERRIAEVQKGEEKFRQLLESAPDAMVIVDEGGNIVLINAQTEALFGYSRTELLGQPVELLLPNAYRERHPALRAGYAAAPQVRHTMAQGIDLQGQRKDGTLFSAEINLSPISTADGNLVTAVIRDVTERKRLEAARARTHELESLNRRAQEANRLKSEFLANMSHELRTPLNAIIGFSSLLHEGRVGALSETQTEYLGDILTSSRHLLHLINDVLDLAKIEAGRMELRPELVNVERIALEVRDTLRAVAMEKRLSLQVEVSAALPEVVTDPRLLKQVLYNFASNAIKFSVEAGRVRVHVSPEPPGWFTVSVSDDGIGIAAENLPRLFQQFEQLDSSASKRYAGTGLGLALTKRIVEAQGGTVNVRSEAGRGATFSATLPQQPLPAPSAKG